MASRRKFIKRSGIATVVGAGVATPILSRVITQQGPIKIKLFFTQHQHEKIGAEIDTFRKEFKLYFLRALRNTQLDTIDVSVTTEQSPVELFSSDREKDEMSARTRRTRLYQWYQYTKKNSVELAEHSNILIDSTSLGTRGVASIPLTPPCCSNIQNVGILWSPIVYWPPFTFIKKDVFRVLSHEVGHNIGLTHAHGGNFELGARSVMLKSEYAESVGTNIFGEKVSPAPHEKQKFNPKISYKHLSL